MLRRFWAATERREPVDHYLAAGFQITGSLIYSDPDLSAGSMDERYRQLDRDTESWFLRLFDVITEPDGGRMATIIEAGVTHKDGVKSANLGGYVFTFEGPRIASAAVFQDASDALREIGVDPVVAFAERRDDPELVVWEAYTRVNRGQAVDDLFAPGAQLVGDHLPITDNSSLPDTAGNQPEVPGSVHDGQSVNLADTFIAADGRVVATVYAVGSNGASGEGQVGAGVFEVRGGLIRQATTYTDVRDALEEVRPPDRTVADFHDLFDAAGVGLLHNAADGSIIDANGRAATILGVSPEQLRGLTPMDPRWRAVHEDDSPFPGEEHPVSVTLRTGVEQTDVIMGIHKPDGTLSWISVTSRLVSSSNGDGPAEVLVSFTDVTGLMEANETAKHGLEIELMHDALTGLPNRVLFMDRVEQALGHAQRREGGVAVLFIDLDHFKEINDHQGHQTGDRTLVAVGRLVTNVLRPGDTVARLSGDEFAVLCLDCRSKEAQEVATRISAVIAQVPDGSGNGPLRASTGIALSDGAEITAASLLARADQAMYVAKQEGLGGHSLFASDVL